MTQLGLFDRLGGPAPAQGGVEPDPELAQLASRLPRHLRFGTCSWTFPGWTMVYRRSYPSKAAFVRESLAEYCQYPLFRSVEIDRSYYGPLSASDVRSYAERLPAGFDVAMKVWEEITAMVFPAHPRYRERAGRDNPHFLDPAAFREFVIAPIEEAAIGAVGPLIIEIAPLGAGAVDNARFETLLAQFLSRVPSGYRYAVELRDRRLLSRRYLSILRDHGACHVFNYWSRMPTLRDQLAIDGTLPGPFAVVRLMIPPGRRYEDQKAAFEPFDRIVQPDPAMRDDVVRLIDAAGEHGYPIHVFANNKAEGSSPLTVRAIAEMVAARG